MPRKLWTKKDERKYEKILESCRLERPRGKKRTVAACKRIAAATVNRDRKAGLRGRGLGAIRQEDAAAAMAELRARMLEESSLGADAWQAAQRRRDMTQEHPSASTAWSAAWDYANAVAHYQNAATLAKLLNEPLAEDMRSVVASVQWDAADFAEWLALSLQGCFLDGTD